MLGHRGVAGVLGALALLAVGVGASATPMVVYTVDDLGGGQFQYNLTLQNGGGGEALSGLNVLHGDSVFGLDDSSSIGAPSGWSYFAPFPSLIDDLNYFSLGAGTDVPIGGTLGGFSFVSTTDPDSIGGDDFHVEGIGADSATQIDLGNAQLVPEPTTALLLLSALAGLAASRGAVRSR